MLGLTLFSFTDDVLMYDLKSIILWVIIMRQIDDIRSFISQDILTSPNFFLDLVVPERASYINLRTCFNITMQSD